MIGEVDDNAHRNGVLLRVWLRGVGRRPLTCEPERRRLRLRGCGEAPCQQQKCPSSVHCLHLKLTVAPHRPRAGRPPSQWRRSPPLLATCPSSNPARAERWPDCDAGFLPERPSRGGHIADGSLPSPCRLCVPFLY